jgi:hypothetical protein
MSVKTNVVSYDVLENKRDVSGAFFKIRLPQTPMLNMIGVGAAISNTKHFWWDDVIIPHKTTLSAAYDQSDDASVLHLTSTSSVRVGTVLRIAGQIKRISVVTDTTHVTTVHLGGESDADIASGTAVEFVANAALESAEAADSDYTQKTEIYNVTQIFNDFIKISGTQLEIQREIAGEIFTDEVARKMERIRLGLGRAIWTNPRIAPSDNNTPRVMGGIKYFVETYGYKPTSATFSADNIDSFLLEMEVNYGYVPNELWMNPSEIAHFTGLLSDKIQVDHQDQIRGIFVGRYISKYGHIVALRSDPNAPVDQIYAIDPARISLRPLANRSLAVGDLAKKGDYRQSMIVGEYTLEIIGSNAMGVFTLSA